MQHKTRCQHFLTSSRSYSSSSSHPAELNLPSSNRPATEYCALLVPARFARKTQSILLDPQGGLICRQTCCRLQQSCAALALARFVRNQPANVNVRRPGLDLPTDLLPTTAILRCFTRGMTPYAVRSIQTSKSHTAARVTVHLLMLPALYLIVPLQAAD